MNRICSVILVLCLVVGGSTGRFLLDQDAKGNFYCDSDADCAEGKCCLPQYMAYGVVDECQRCPSPAEQPERRLLSQQAATLTSSTNVSEEASVLR